MGLLVSSCAWTNLARFSERGQNEVFLPDQEPMTFPALEENGPQQSHSQGPRWQIRPRIVCLSHLVSVFWNWFWKRNRVPRDVWVACECELHVIFSAQSSTVHQKNQKATKLKQQGQEHRHRLHWQREKPMRKRRLPLKWSNKQNKMKTRE